MDRKADPPPLETDDVRAVAIGTIAWAVAFIALLPFRSTLADHGRSWWLGVCAAGFVLGLLGLAYCIRRAAAIARDRESANQHEV